MENKSGEEKWSLGERLLVRWKGIFYAARIIKMALNKDGRVVFTVHYEGWNESFDENISAESAKRRFKKRQGEFHDDPTNNLYVVEEIRAMRWSKEKETPEFLIRWKNYDEKGDSWEPEALLRETPEVAEMLEEFLAKNPPVEVSDNTKGAAENEKLVNSKSSGGKQSIPKKPVKRPRPGPPRDTSTSVLPIQSPPKKYVKPLIEGEEARFCIVPFLQMNGRAEGGLIQNQDVSSSSGFGTSIARPFIVEATKQRVTKSTEVEGSAKEFMTMWNEFLLRERTTNLGQDFIYPALEKFIDSLIDRMKTDSAFALCSQLFTLLSALVTARAISNAERFALFARIDPEGAKGLMDVVPPPEEEKEKRGRPRKSGFKNSKNKKSIGGGMKKKNCSPSGVSEQSPPVKFFPTLAESARRRNQPETKEKGEENEEPSSSQSSMENDN